jgi:hypothetical protein
MAINNLEQAAMTAASTGVTPTPTRVPQYEDKPGDEWMSYVPEAYGELPNVIGEQRKLQAQQLREGVPEVIRQAAQPMTRRGLFGSGLQLEDIGQAGLQRQQAIQNAELLAKIDPIKARVAMGDIAQKRFQDRAQESRRRYEKEEAYRQQERAREDLMRQQTGSSLMNMVTGKGGVNEALFGSQPTAMQQLLLANEKDPQKRAALSKQMGIGQPSFVLKAAVGEERANQLAQGGIAGAVISSIIPKEGILGAPIKAIDSALEKIGGALSGLFGGKAKEPVKQLKPVGQPTMGNKKISYTQDEQGNIISDGEVIRQLPQNQMMRDAVYREDFLMRDGQEVRPLPQTKTVDYTETPIEQEARLASQLGEMTFEQEAAIRNMPRVGETVDIEEAARLGSLEGGSRGESLMDLDNIDRSNIEELPVEEIFKKTPFTEQEGGPYIEPREYISAFRDSGPYVPDEALGAAMEADYFQDGLNTTFEQFADEYAPSIGSGMTDSLQGISDLVPGNIVDTGIGLAISSALNPEGLKGVLDNPMSFIGPQIMAQSGVGPLSIAKMLATQTAPTGAALGSALAGSVIGLPMALMGMGAAKGKKDRARDEAEEIRNRTGSARYNFVPGELAMVGNARRSPVLDEANVNFRFTDELTGMNLIYEQDPRRSVMGGDSLSKRGQDFAREAGIDYTNPDPDIQNTSQKWLGKQQVYSELIPELKPVFMAGLKGQMTREQTEDLVAEISNKYFMDNPQINELRKVISEIDLLTEANRVEADSFVEDDILELRKQAEIMKTKVPDSWKSAPSFEPKPIFVSVELDDRFVESED